MIQYLYIHQFNHEYEKMIDEIIMTSISISKTFYYDQDKVYVFHANQSIDAHLIIQNIMSETLINIHAYASYQIKEESMDYHIETMKRLTRHHIDLQKGLITDHDIVSFYHGTYQPELKSFILKKYSNHRMMEDSVIKYLRVNQNMSVAAKELYVHRNTLMTRIEKFFDITGFNVKSFYDAYLMYGLLTQKVL